VAQFGNYGGRNLKGLRGQGLNDNPSGPQLNSKTPNRAKKLGLARNNRAYFKKGEFWGKIGALKSTL